MNLTNKKRILYVGNVGQVGTALTVHAQNMGRLFQSIGYDVSFVCDRGMGSIFPDKYKGFDYTYTKNYIKIPKVRAIEWMAEEILGFKLLHLVKRKMQEKTPDAIILYGYSVEKELLKICKKKRIPLIVERVDWFEKEDRNGVFAKYFIQKNTDNAILKNDFSADGVIVISEYLFNHFNDKGQRVTFVPPIFNFQQTSVISRINSGVLKLVYAGSFGGCKDQIIPVIEALESINKDKIKISLNLVGISFDELKNVIRGKEYNLKGIQAYGRVSNEKAKEIVKKSDFSLLLRQNKRYAKAGFSTKFAESMSLGVPVICTKVGGADSIITNMVDGIHLSDNVPETVAITLNQLLQMSNEQLLEIKRNAFKTACKYFYIDYYKNQMTDFMNSILEKME